MGGMGDKTIFQANKCKATGFQLWLWLDQNPQVPGVPAVKYKNYLTNIISKVYGVQSFQTFIII